jgi:deoxycytidylate deaminase
MKIRDDIIELAIAQAKKSPMGYKHGSVIWKGNDIIGTGYNWPVHPPGGLGRRFSIHSERDALKNLRADQIIGSRLLCVRITPFTEKLTSSRPCKGCTRLLKRKGVESIFWFDTDGNINRTYL